MPRRPWRSGPARWGGCNTDSRTIRLNTKLAVKPRECLEYLIVHELVHLQERHHTERLPASMDEYLPQWRQLRKLLNTAPLGHETWCY
jgi:predicted metal-dependent hydrolase